MKTMVISHNPISTDNNMGKTLLSLLKIFDAENVCQLYVHPSVPDIKKCKSYYKLTDKMVAIGAFDAKKSGEIFDLEGVQPTQKEKSSIEEKAFTNKKQNRELKLFLRSLIWTIGRWNTRKLKDWIKEQAPDVIFATGGVSAFFYSVVLKIAKKHKLPVVLYVCDDFYFSGLNKKGIIAKAYYSLLHKNIKKLGEYASSIVAICESLCKEYCSEFDAQGVVIYTGAELSVTEKPQKNEASKVLRYFGNLFLNRNVALADIGKCLDEINEQKNTDFTLEIYTNTKDRNITDVFEGKKSISVYDFVDAESVQRLMDESAAVLHVEGFAKQGIDRVKYSISTKIPEALASGKCLFAYGPQEVASMQHLIKNECAITATSKEELKSKLLSAFEDSELRARVKKNAVQTAKKYHDSDKNSSLLREALEKAAKK